MDVVNQGTAFSVDFTFPAVPTAVSYHIYDFATAANVRGETDVAPAQSVTIAIASSDAAILDSSKSVNRRLVVASSTYNNDPEQSKIDTYEFGVRNVVSV